VRRCLPTRRFVWLGRGGAGVAVSEGRVIGLKGCGIVGVALDAGGDHQRLAGDQPAIAAQSIGLGEQVPEVRVAPQLRRDGRQAVALAHRVAAARPALAIGVDRRQTVVELDIRHAQRHAVAKGAGTAPDGMGPVRQAAGIAVVIGAVVAGRAQLAAVEPVPGLMRIAAVEGRPVPRRAVRLVAPQRLAHRVVGQRDAARTPVLDINRRQHAGRGVGVVAVLNIARLGAVGRVIDPRLDGAVVPAIGHVGDRARRALIAVAVDVAIAARRRARHRAQRIGGGAVAILVGGDAGDDVVALALGHRVRGDSSLGVIDLGMVVDDGAAFDSVHLMQLPAKPVVAVGAAAHVAVVHARCADRFVAVVVIIGRGERHALEIAGQVVAIGLDALAIIGLLLLLVMAALAAIAAGIKYRKMVAATAAMVVPDPNLGIAGKHLVAGHAVAPAERVIADVDARGAAHDHPAGQLPSVRDHPPQRVIAIPVGGAASAVGTVGWAMSEWLPSLRQQLSQ
jgi:hypothetical protein